MTQKPVNSCCFHMNFYPNNQMNRFIHLYISYMLKERNDDPSFQMSDCAQCSSSLVCFTADLCCNCYFAVKCTVRSVRRDAHGVKCDHTVNLHEALVSACDGTTLLMVSAG